MAGPRCARLADGWLLRGWSDVPWAAVNWKRGAVRTLNRDAFYVARCCDGRTNFDSPAFLPDHRPILDHLIAEGIAQERTSPSDAAPGEPAYRRAPNPFLHGLHWSITSRCNLRCRHCIMEAPSQRYRELSHEEAVRLVDQFDRANVPQVALTGGEPFLRPDLLDLVERLTERRIGITEIATNGLLITKRWLDALAVLDVNPLFRISFDGCGVHDGMRGARGVEARTIRAIERLRAAGRRVAVITSIDRRGVDSLPRTYELMKSLDVTEWCVGIPGEAGTWRHAESGLSVAAMTDACLALAERWRDEGQPLRIWLWRFGRLPRPAGPERPRTWNCPATHLAPYVLPDATLLPCGGYTDSPLVGSMPNLLTTGLAEAWTDSAVRRIADLRPDEVAARNPTCAACDLFPRCGGGCRVQALRASGELMARDAVMCGLWKQGTMDRLQTLVSP